jgi:hypothetical protein
VGSGGTAGGGATTGAVVARTTGAAVAGAGVGVEGAGGAEQLVNSSATMIGKCLVGLPTRPARAEGCDTAIMAPHVPFISTVSRQLSGSMLIDQEHTLSVEATLM